MSPRLLLFPFRTPLLILSSSPRQTTSHGGDREFGTRQAQRLRAEATGVEGGAGRGGCGRGQRLRTSARQAEGAPCSRESEARRLGNKRWTGRGDDEKGMTWGLGSPPTSYLFGRAQPLPQISLSLSLVWGQGLPSVHAAVLVPRCVAPGLPTPANTPPPIPAPEIRRRHHRLLVVVPAAAHHDGGNSREGRGGGFGQGSGGVHYHDEVQWVFAGVGRSDLRGGRPDPQLPRGEAHRRPLRHGKGHQQPPPGWGEGGELWRPEGIRNR